MERLLVTGSAIVVVLVVCSVWIRLPRADFALELTVTSVQARLSRDWRLTESFDVGDVVLEGMQGIFASSGIFPVLGSSQDPASRAEIRGGGVMIEGLTVDAGASLELVSSRDEATLFVKDERVAGVVFIQAADVVLESGDLRRVEQSIRTNPLRPPEVLRFESGRGSRRPATVRFGSPGVSLAMDLEIDQLTFIEEAPNGPSKFRSTILEGEVRVLCTGQTFTLRGGDHLQLGGIATRTVEFARRDDGSLRVFAEGSATTLRTGPMGYERSLKPTVLAFMYEQTLVLGVLWVIGVLVPALIWQIREVASPRR